MRLRLKNCADFFDTLWSFKMKRGCINASTDVVNDMKLFALLAAVQHKFSCKKKSQYPKFRPEYLVQPSCQDHLWLFRCDSQGGADPLPHFRLGLVLKINIASKNTVYTAS